MSDSKNQDALESATELLAEIMRGEVNPEDEENQSESRLVRPAMKSINLAIPEGKLGQFDEILKACGGRYLSNPVERPNEYGHWRVSFSYDSIKDANEHNRRWRRVTEDIKEKVRKKKIRKPWWARLFPA